MVARADDAAMDSALTGGTGLERGDQPMPPAVLVASAGLSADESAGSPAL